MAKRYIIDAIQATHWSARLRDLVCRVGMSAEVDRVSGQAGTGARGLEDTSRA